MIPKIIHLTWFSGNEYPNNIKRCLETWKKVLPDFEVKIWTMEMARALNIPFVNEALDARKWAFAGDVVRAYAVWSEGGVYMDTDIWVLKRFDEFLTLPMAFFMEINRKEWEMDNPEGIVNAEGLCLIPEQYVKGRQIQAALFMGEKGNPILKDIIDFYRTLKFIRDDGSFNYTISPCIYAKLLEKYGFLYKDEEQHLENDITVFPSSYVALSRYERSKNAIAIHLGAHEWDPRGPWLKFKYIIHNSRFYSLLKLLGIERFRRLYWSKLSKCK